MQGVWKNWVSTYQSVVLTADVFQFLWKIYFRIFNKQRISIQSRELRKQRIVTKQILAYYCITATADAIVSENHTRIQQENRPRTYRHISSLFTGRLQLPGSFWVVCLVWAAFRNNISRVVHIAGERLKYPPLSYLYVGDWRYTQQCSTHRTDTPWPAVDHRLNFI